MGGDPNHLVANEDPSPTQLHPHLKAHGQHCTMVRVKEIRSHPSSLPFFFSQRNKQKSRCAENVWVCISISTPQNMYVYIYIHFLVYTMYILFNRGGYIKEKFWATKSFQYTKWREKTIRNSTPVGWASGNQWLDFERRNPTSGLKMPTEKMVMFFSRWDPFFWKVHPSKTKSNKDTETWWQRPSKTPYWGAKGSFSRAILPF